MTENDLQEINALVAQHYRGRHTGMSASNLFAIERHLLTFGLKLDHPIGPPDPHAPDGGTTLALAA